MSGDASDAYNRDMQTEDEELAAGMELSHAVKTSEVLSEATVKLIGDRATICQTVQLLAFIRNLIRNGAKRSITVDVCGKVNGGKLLFDVNGMEIPDLIAPDRMEID